jgi:hypothetical protein
MCTTVCIKLFWIWVNLLYVNINPTHKMTRTKHIHILYCSILEMPDHSSLNLTANRMHKKKPNSATMKNKKHAWQYVKMLHHVNKIYTIFLHAFWSCPLPQLVWNWSLQSNTGFRYDDILTQWMSLQFNRELHNDHHFVARWIMKILNMYVLQSLITNKIIRDLPSTLLSPKIWATRTPTVIPRGHKTPIAPRMLRGEISVRYIGMVLVTRPEKREHTSSQTSELCKPTHT